MCHTKYSKKYILKIHFLYTNGIAATIEFIFRILGRGLSITSTHFAFNSNVKGKERCFGLKN